MNTIAHRTALSGCFVIATLAMVGHAQAQTTVDMSNAITATGPAGLIATNVSITSPESSAWVMMWSTKYQQGPGCEYTGCADGINGDVTPTQDGSLLFNLKDTPVGDVKGWAPTSSHSSAQVDRKAFISGHANGQGIYTELVDPANTSFSFTFSGHSAAAGQGVQVQLDLNALNEPYNALFSQTATMNDAGDWSLVIDTPLGLDLLGKRINFGISAASGANTVTSFLVTPHLNVVPEPATWALTGLGLVGLGWARRRQHG